MSNFSMFLNYFVGTHKCSIQNFYATSTKQVIEFRLLNSILMKIDNNLNYPVKNCSKKCRNMNFQLLLLNKTFFLKKNNLLEFTKLKFTKITVL